eukprot:scaffold19406_cov84-Isochrysis_galbana.AAC.1
MRSAPGGRSMSRAPWAVSSRSSMAGAAASAAQASPPPAVSSPPSEAARHPRTAAAAGEAAATSATRERTAGVKPGCEGRPSKVSAIGGAQRVSRGSRESMAHRREADD